MNLRALQYFVKLADLKHFSNAAEACYVSQPTLSTQIKKLEEELGVQLVERAPRQVMLTPIGKEVARRAQVILSDLRQIETLTRNSKDPSAGNLKIGIFPTLAPYLLPHVVPNIRKTYPRLKLQLLEEKTEIILELLKQGRLDAVLVALPLDDDTLEREVLFEESFLLAVPGQHDLAKREVVAVNDLKDEELLLLEDGHCMREQALEVCELAGAREKTEFQATSMETLRQMVAAEVGITLMPSMAVSPPIAQTPNLTVRRFSGRNPKRTIAMAWRSSSALSDFLRELAGQFRSVPEAILKAERAH